MTTMVYSHIPHKKSKTLPTPPKNNICKLCDQPLITNYKYDYTISFGYYGCIHTNITK